MRLSSCSTLVAWIRPWLQLVKVPLCLPVACSAGFGSILYAPVLSRSLGLVVCGVFFLACGAAGSNSLQEISVDQLLSRTRWRPLPTGRLTGPGAFGCSALLVIFGLVSLRLSAAGWLPLFLGITALMLYNGIYTPLKQTSIFALFTGGLVGAIPPLIGWIAAGGTLDDRRVWLLCALFFLWQIPHFCLHLLSYQEDYQSVPQPTLIRLLPEQSLKRITLVWILAFTVGALSLGLCQDLFITGSRLAIGLMAAVMIALCIPLFLIKKAAHYRRLFVLFNGSFLITMLLVALLQLLAT